MNDEGVRTAPELSRKGEPESCLPDTRLTHRCRASAERQPPDHASLFGISPVNFIESALRWPKRSPRAQWNRRRRET